jgi:putative flavoprotein involved in K+ transport
VIVIGAGGSGLSVSYHLTRLGVEHIVIERGQVGNSWAADRWDSFHLVNPNWALRLHGFEYRGDNPDGYLSRAETVKLLENYASLFGAPVRTGVDVVSLERACPEGFILRTSTGDMVAENVIVATGAFGRPAFPAGKEDIPAGITQVHSNEYKSASQLPDGAVLVIGSGQSGAQIMEDLFDSGRRVYLSVGKAGRRPRRYRGKDSSWWNNEMGGFDQTIADVKSLSEARFGSSSHTSGTKGGHSIYLRAFARDGVTLVGRFVKADGCRLTFADDVRESLDAADAHAERWRRGVDAYIEENGLDMPPEPSPDPEGLDRYPEQDPPTGLDLRAAGISTIIWATGYRYDYSWIKLPVSGERGFPVQRRGVTVWPGLYFTGLHWMHSAKSAQFIGVGEDASYVAEHIASRLKEKD